MNNYKLSRYNVIFTRDFGMYLWNTLTGALLTLNEEDVSYLGTFNGMDDGSATFNALKDHGCIIDARYDELGKVLYDEKSVMLNPRPMALHYTIAPGLDCNYNCPYCFEKDRTSQKVMGQDMQDKVCRFIIRAADKCCDLQQIGITWFGGEPLLHMDAIEHISKQLMEYCEQRQIKYSAGIVTNGRFLTRDNAHRLKQLNVEYVQMAVDGMGKAYAKAKGTSPDSFDKVVENIVSSADILPITVRINVTDTIDEAVLLTDYLLREKQLDGRIKTYIAHVRDYSDHNMLRERLSHEHFLQLEKEYMDFFADSGGLYSPSSLFYSKPKRRCTTCLSVCDTNYCIGPEGELYRCEHMFGNSTGIVGMIDAGRFYPKNELAYIKHIHPKKCEECQLLPVCMGGCMNDNLSGEVALSCEKFKERLIDYLLLDDFPAEDKT